MNSLQKTKPFFLACALTMLLAGMKTASGTPTTYSYTGANFNLLNSSYSLNQPYTPDPGFTYASNDALTFSFTLSNALAAGSTTTLNTTDSVTWVASDGKFTFGGTGQVGLFSSDDYHAGLPVSVVEASFTTNASGAIVGWYFDLFYAAQASQLYSSSSLMPLGASLGFGLAYDYAYSRPGTTGYTDDPIEWAAATTLGTWTYTGTSDAVPESTSTFAMLFPSFGLMAVMARYLSAKNRRISV